MDRFFIDKGVIHRSIWITKREIEEAGKNLEGLVQKKLNEAKKDLMQAVDGEVAVKQDFHFS